MCVRPALRSRLSVALALRISLARRSASICWSNERSGGVPARLETVVGGDGPAGGMRGDSTRVAAPERASEAVPEKKAST